MRSTTQGKFVKPVYYCPESPERQSMSLARVTQANIPISEREQFREPKHRRIQSFKYDDQKYNLDSFKRRTKNSKKNIGKTSLKWNVLNTDQNYNSNLPMIGKTRTHISSDNCSLEQLSLDAMYKKNKSKNNIVKEQRINNEKDPFGNYFNTNNTTAPWHNSTNK